MSSVFRKLTTIPLVETWWLMYGMMRGSRPLARVSNITNAIITTDTEAAGTEDKRVPRASPEHTM